MIVNLRSSKIIFDHHWSMMTESHPAVEKNQPLPLSFCREIVCWRGKEKERGKQWSLLIIDDQCNRRLPSIQYWSIGDSKKSTMKIVVIWWSTYSQWWSMMIEMMIFNRSYDQYWSKYINGLIDQYCVDIDHR